MSVGSVPAAGQGEGGRQQVVHMREGSESSLQDLFSVVNNPERAQNLFKEKKLPESFFRPPDPNRHSRENSTDGIFPPSSSSSHLVPQHSRSRSSPAQLPNTLSLPAPAHRQQLSVDFTEEMALGWQDRNQRYTLNSGGGSSTTSGGSGSGQWAQQKSLSSGNLVEGGGALSPASSHGPSPATSLQNLTLSPLPQGWDVSLTGDNEVYFINHIHKTTSWYHPAIPKQNQGPGPLKLTQLAPAQQQVILQQQQLQQQQQQQQPQQPRRSPIPPPAAAAAPPSGALESQKIAQELQRLQKEKERLQREQEEIARKERLLQQRNAFPSPGGGGGGGGGGGQQQQPAAGPASAAAAAGLGIIDEVATVANNPARPRFDDYMLKELMAPPVVSSSSTTGLDPFLGSQPGGLPSSTGGGGAGGAGSVSEAHARQNSGDSGLGGMGTSYSLPRTPEDFLSNVDEMDSSEPGQKLKHSLVLGSDFNMNDMQGGGGPMELGVDSASNVIGSEDLVPSLQEDISSMDLLNDMDIQKELYDTPTWL